MTTDTTFEQQQQTGPQSEAQAGGDSQFWCNFCDFRTNDSQAYLSHSCQDVLAQRGVTVESTGQNECR